MSDLKTFLSKIAVDPTKLGEFLLDPEKVMSAAKLSDEDKTALRAGVPALIAARLAGRALDEILGLQAGQPFQFVVQPPQFVVHPPQFVVQPPPQFVVHPPHFVVQPPPQFVVHPPQFVVQPPPQFVVYPPPQFVVHPPQFVVQPPPQFVVHPPQFVVQPPPQFVVQPTAPKTRSPGTKVRRTGRAKRPKK